MYYTQKEIDIVKRKYPNNGTAGVQKFLKRSVDSIRHQAKKQGITRTEGFRESKIDASKFIDNINQESAYILGLIWGDGHLRWDTQYRQYRVELTLKESDFKDISHLIPEFKRHHIKKQKSNWEQCITAYLNHKTLAIFLKSMDFCKKSKASPIKILQHIPNNLHYLFWRGYFDADGSNNDLPKGKYKLCIAGNFSQSWVSLQDVSKKLILYLILTE